MYPIRSHKRNEERAIPKGNITTSNGNKQPRRARDKATSNEGGAERHMAANMAEIDRN